MSTTENLWNMAFQWNFGWLFNVRLGMKSVIYECVKRQFFDYVWKPFHVLWENSDKKIGTKNPINGYAHSLSKHFLNHQRPFFPSLMHKAKLRTCRCLFFRRYLKSGFTPIENYKKEASNWRPSFKFSSSWRCASLLWPQRPWGRSSKKYVVRVGEAFRQQVPSPNTRILFKM